MTSPAAPVRRVRADVHGAVQGVGFRPFVYRLARDLELAGWVANDTTGVRLEVEGGEQAVERFLEELRASPPPLAVLEEVRTEIREPAGYGDFEILRSEAGGERSAFVLPDTATCDACLREIRSPGDRRHGYPFTNCTDCGPRFSIVRDLPYDRPATTMAGFRMCGPCRTEYEEPADRRFHAQPNACPECGPRLRLLDADGAPVAGPGHDDADPLVRAAGALAGGRIVAVKGLGGFHLMVDAADGEAVAELRRRKGRPTKPLAVMAADLASARRLCRVPGAAAEALTGPGAPIVLLERRPGAGISGEVAPGNPRLGLMLPYTPLHHLLMDELDGPVVATSGNVSGEPICTDVAEALERLGGVADLFLVHDRPIERPVDDSVARVSGGELRLLRRSRGWAPLPVRLDRTAPSVLAVGPHLKNTVTLTRGRQAFLSQHVGDLDTLEARDVFERVVDDLLRLYGVAPAAVAHDLHPDYASTALARRLAREWGIPRVEVQHHHAHLAACLAEHGDPGPALGMVWDGTGLGSDGTVWGGEFLLGDARSFRRVGHLRPFRLPGGDRAAREPRRSALALLWELLGPEALERTDLPPVAAFRPDELRVLGRMLEGGSGSPVTTSCGRLFDGVAALLDLRQRSSFEGEAAMALEFAADPDERSAYRFVVRPPGPVEVRPGVAPGGNGRGGHGPAEDSPLVLDWGPALAALLEDVAAGEDAGTVSARFHAGLTRGAVEMARRLAAERVVLTGGCFQNRRLAAATAAALRRTGARVLTHREVPPNDGGVSLGQAAVAAARLERADDDSTRE